MKTSLKIILSLFIIGIILVSIWLSLDSHTKCKLIYGKNICNFYEMMDIVSYNSEKSDFEKAMQLCREMEDVPKKDSCFEHIAQVVSFYNIENAKQACGEIKELEGVHSKEECYSMVGRSREERLAESSVVVFMEARIQRDQALALSWLTDNAEGQYLLRSDLPLTGLSNPYFADFEILEREQLSETQFRFKVRIYEEYTGQGRVGYFDETLTVIKSDEKYLIDSFERSQYQTQGRITIKQSGGAGMLIAECGDKNYISGEADYIIEGIVKKVESKWDEEKTSIFTYTDLSIEKQIKGIPFAGNELQIITPGGTVGELSQWAEDQPIFHEGKKVRIYFRENNGEFSIICAQFGVEEI